MSLPSIHQYLSLEEVRGIYKAASVEPEKADWAQRAKAVGSGLLGMTVGGLAGFGGMEAADRLLGGGGAGSPNTGIPSSALNKIVPLATAGAGLTYALWKAREMEKLRRAVKPSPDDKPADQ